MDNCVPGSLARLAKMRMLPPSDPKCNARPRKIMPTDQVIPIIINNDPFSLDKYNRILSYFLARFYQTTGPRSVRQNTKKESLVGCIAGILANSADFHDISPWENMKTAFECLEINLITRTMTWEEFQAMMRNDQNREFLNLWGIDVNYILENTYIPFVFSCVIILSMIKNLTTDEFEYWVAQIYKVLDPNAPSFSSKSQLPLPESLRELRGIITAFYGIRKEFHYEMVRLASLERTFISSGISEILNAMRGHKIEHLILIDKYIMEKHPSLISTFMLRGFKEDFQGVIPILRALPANEMLYVMIIKDKYETSLLDKKHFVAANIVANTIAQYFNPSHEYSPQNMSEADKRYQLYTLQYLQARYPPVLLQPGENHDNKTIITPEDMQKFVIKYST